MCGGNLNANLNATELTVDTFLSSGGLSHIDIMPLIHMLQCVEQIPAKFVRLLFDARQIALGKFFDAMTVNHY